MDKKGSGGKKLIAAHMHNDDCHMVILNSLRVLIEQEDNYWFAQGLEIDYAASGNSLENVKSNFEKGLSGSIEEHLQMYGKLDNFLKVAPQDAWEPVLKNSSQFSLTVKMLVPKQQAPKLFPFDNIAYLEPQAAVA